MKLYFLRHGVADWPNWNKPDDQRPLTPEGIERLKAQSKALKRLDLKLDVILSSPLPRAKQTAEIVADRLGLKVTTSAALAPGFDMAKLTKLLAAHAKAEAVMLAGHEPDFSTCISGLIGGGRIELKKGGLARVDLETLEPPAGELVWLLGPRTMTGDKHE